MAQPEEIDTLWAEQITLRGLANRAWDFLFEGKDISEKAKESPRSKIQQMIDFERETIGILQDIVETLPELGK